MVPRASQVALLTLLVGCDSPARVKPWRHAPDPTAEAANAPGSPALADRAAEAEERAGRGHTLRIHVDADPGRLNPLVSPTVWGRRITHGTIFETLVRYVPPDGAQAAAGRYAPRLARSWRVSPWGNEILIELEPGVRFHDGRPLTTADVQFTLDAVREQRRGIDHLRPLLEDVEAVELVTATTLRIRLKRPSGYVLRALAEIPILPMHVYDGSLLAGGALVGTGPWKLASHKGGTVHLTRFDRYWGPPAPIADLEFVYQPDAALALKDAKRGELDLVPALIAAHWPEQASAPGIAAAFQPLELRPPRFRYLAFNAKRPITSDARVRHALALLVNRREIEKRVFDGLARPALWPIWPGGFVSGPEVPVPAFDPAGAGKLLDEAGWIDAAPKDGVRDHDGAQLRLVMVGGEQAAGKDAGLPGASATARDMFVEAARRIGVVIEVRTGNEAWIAKRIEEGTYDIAELVWTGMVDGDVAPRLGGNDPQRASSPRIEHVLEALAAAWDPAERTKLSAELAAALAETWPIAGIVADAPHGLVHRAVQGVRPWDGWLDLTQLRLAPKQP
ncbi:MAG TPA: ABC transporter substrate-binding protein [Kofleriaceae bacterium]|nr:ABC transporter substrate-binding protein [Kofleriaceae bacterium]